MSRYLIMVAAAANRVYAGEAPQLTATELEICSRMLQAAGPVGIEATTVAGVDYVGFRIDQPDQESDQRIPALVARLSAGHALFEQLDTGSVGGPLLRPVPLAHTDRFGDDLASIPKYQGKTNEQFTRMLINVTAASMTRPTDGRPISLLDPLCGRGTTLSVGLTLGYDVAGVESQDKAVEAYAAFLKTYLRRKRIKHKAELNPVRREGRSLGRRLDVQVAASQADRPQELTVFTGDTRQSAELYGKRRFDLVVTDAPYGVVHGSSSRSTRDRSPAQLLTEAVPVWSRQLKSGGALGIAWNTYGLEREHLDRIAVEAGLEPLADGPYLRLGHRVDSSIHRDVFIARKPAGH